MDPNSYTARDLMTKKVVTLSPDMEVSEAFKAITKNKIPVAPVVDEHNKLLGMCAETDLLKSVVGGTYMNNIVVHGKVSDIMTTKVKTVEPETNLMSLATLFLSHKFRRFPVVDHGFLIGLVSRLNVLKTVETLIRKNANQTPQPSIKANPKDERM